MHRNVVFRNADVPGLPASFIDGPRASQLWASLDAQCNGKGGSCDSLIIPHNSNLSAGYMFNSLDDQGQPKTEWQFRHDKIMEFFIVQSFFGEENERLLKHIADPRFRGVYFLLAILLPLKEAEVLREQLIQHAADKNDHTVSDQFIQLLRSRKVN